MVDLIANHEGNSLFQMHYMVGLIPFLLLGYTIVNLITATSPCGIHSDITVVLSLGHTLVDLITAMSQCIPCNSLSSCLEYTVTPRLFYVWDALYLI